MKFDSNSVALKCGSRARIDIYIPSSLLDIEISDQIWQAAIDEFNHKLNGRPSITTLINGVEVDVLKVESVSESSDVIKMGAIVLLVIVREEDFSKIVDIHFCLTGYLTFDENSGSLRKMTINDITYGGDDSKRFHILDDLTKRK